MLYFGTIAFIGLTVPGGYYSPFLDHYFNYPSWLRSSILNASRALLNLLGYPAYRQGIYSIQLRPGSYVRLVYSCLGYGIMSFWAAYIIANQNSLIKKALWILGGWGAIWLINVSRISFLLLANSTGRGMPFRLDHHTLFTLFAYGLVFVMIWLYNRQRKQSPNKV